MKTALRLFCLTLALLLAMPLSGCSKTEDAYIYFELPEPPSTLDPQTAQTDSELLIVKNIYEGLLRKNENGEIVCGAAKNYNKNGLVYTFELRDNIKWSNGEKLTANDFVYGMQRALSSETKAPFASRLFSIINAEELYNGKISPDQLGVKAIDEKTVEITLKQEDDRFEENLTTSVAMPCNEEFFISSAGKYGLFADNIIGNGSYKLTRWRKDPFGIRLYSNTNYNGNMTAENAAVFITCDPEEAAIDKLSKNSVDMAFIDSSLTNIAKEAGLETVEFQNICWVLTLGKDFSPNMRKAFSLLVGSEVYSKDLPVGYYTATSLFPTALDTKNTATGMTGYDLDTAKELYFKEIDLLENKKFPSDVILYYYDDGNVKNIVTDIVGHWQSNLSAFVNIEAVSASSLLTPQLTDQSYRMAFFPIRADNTNISEYVVKFGSNYKNRNDLGDLQTQILKSNSIIPVMFQNTVIAYSPALSKVTTELGNGYIDFAFIIKTE